MSKNPTIKPPFVHFTWTADHDSVCILRSEAARIIWAERRASRMRRMRTKTRVRYDRKTHATVVISPNASLCCAITHSPYVGRKGMV